MARKRLKRTGEPLYPEHPASEHQWRVQRARRIMQDDNLDVLLLGRNVNVFYMSGSRFVFVGMDAPVALAPQSTAIITQDADIYSQRFGPFDTDEVALHTVSSEQLELYDDEMEIVNILKDYGVKRGARIGTEWGNGLCVGINPLKFMKLQQRLCDELGAEIVDASPTIWKMTGVKSDLEIERMKVAVNAAARAMERVYDLIEIGMTELQVSKLASQFMLEEGADAISHAQVMSEGKANISLMSCNAVDRPIESGWVHLDIGAKYRRYGSDINRGIFLGRAPTAEERKMYEIRKTCSQVLDRTIKPGVSVDDVLDTLQAYLATQGCHLKEVGGAIMAGHCLGLEPYQHPNLMPAFTQPEFRNKEGKFLLEHGMLFTYEMAIDMPGYTSTAFFNIEDDVVVTPDGVENMNANLSREMRVK
ncbi:MAG TPA: Xaa-Pro peptidase family protein [Anaerolineae bacterium]|nr:Xaa-Pro peptidase family protein [Anaerolineae bacterium]